MRRNPLKGYSTSFIKTQFEYYGKRYLGAIGANAALAERYRKLAYTYGQELERRNNVQK